MNDPIKDLASSVVSRSIPLESSDGVGIDIVSILTTVLTILPLLPCFRNKDTVSKREWVERNTDLAVARTANEIRKQARGNGERVAVKYSRQLAETIVNDYLSTPDSELRKSGINI